MTAIEHKEIKGITVRNMIITICCTASTVMSVMTMYFNLKSDLSDVNSKIEIKSQVQDIRITALEKYVQLQQRIDAQKKEAK